MNRKLLNGLLLLTVATGGVGTFTSCKDTEEELRNEVLVDINGIKDLSDPVFRKNLEEEIWAQILNYTGQSSEEIKQRFVELAGLLTWSEEAKGELAENSAQIAALQALIGNIPTGSTVWGLIQDLKGDVDELASQYQDLLGKVNTNTEEITKIWSDITTVKGSISDLDDQIQNVIGQLTTLNNKIEKNAQDIADLQAEVANWNSQVASMFSAIAQKLANLITSINIEQVHNWMFGTLDLPFGVSSNIGGAYFADSDHAVNFPFMDGVTAYEYNPNNPALDGTVIDNIMYVLKPTPFKMSANTPTFPGFNNGVDANNNLGTAYVTVNPLNVNFNNVQATLVNTAGEQVLDPLTLKKSNEVLYFGATRAEGQGGLYELNLKANSGTWKDIDAIKVNVEPGLLSAFKNVLKNRSKSDLASLAKLLVDQLNGVLPKYAVKVSWDETDANGNTVQNAVLSPANLAVTAFRPLSYRSAWGFSTTTQLPTFGNVSDFFTTYWDEFKSKVKFNLDLGGFDNIKLDFSGVDVTLNIDNIVLDLSGIPVYKEGEDQTAENIVGVLPNDCTFTIYFDGKGELDSKYDINSNLVDELESMLNDLNVQLDDLTQQVEDQINSVINQINDQLAGLSGQIESQIGGILQDIENALSGKLGKADRLVQLYNDLATRLNTLLSDPSHYLQVMMAYEAGDGLHRLSTNFMDPTPFVGASGKAIRLYATSYNGDIIVPAFKKYVAITNVYEPSGKPVGFFNLNRLNDSLAGLNQVIPGEQHTIGIELNSEFKPGYVYEIFYSALDYRGITSSQKYYIYYGN